MMRVFLSVLCAVAIASILGCAKKAPVDKNGKTPGQVHKECLELMNKGEYEKAKALHDPKYLKDIEAGKYGQKSFEEHCDFFTKKKSLSTVEEKKIEKIEEGFYLSKLRVTDKAGAASGAMADLRLIDGAWKISK